MGRARLLRPPKTVPSFEPCGWIYTPRLSNNRDRAPSGPRGFGDAPGDRQSGTRGAERAPPRLSRTPSRRYRPEGPILTLVCAADVRSFAFRRWARAPNPMAFRLETWQKVSHKHHGPGRAREDPHGQRAAATAGA